MQPAASVSTDERSPKKSGVPIYRAVEPPEEEALLKSGGVPTASPLQNFDKPFWTIAKDAYTFGGMMDTPKGIPFKVWCWPNPIGVGEPGPPMDGMPTWLVPPEELPLVGPGYPLPLKH